MNWKELFERYGEYIIPARYYECESRLTVEELYQTFKARMHAEATENPETPYCEDCMGEHIPGSIGGCVAKKWDHPPRGQGCRVGDTDYG